MKSITDYVIYEDVDLANKLSNMLYSEISEEIFDKCMEGEIHTQVTNKVWELMNDKDSKFSSADFYEGLAKEYEPVDEHDMWSACLYNCDLLYMTAIACVLGLKIPSDSGDIHIFGL